jgi:tRNA (cytidine/uridine-2'-O-)-methyltransferase
LLRANWERCLRIPMPNPRVRSLNLATSVGIALYEALRQTSALGRG